MCFLPAALFVQRKTLRTTTTLFLLIAFLFIAELAQAARFATTTVFRSGGSARYSAGADVNGDGNPDILASNDQALTNGGVRGVLTVLLGKGDGTFLPPKWIADFPDGAPQFAVGDFNRDGRPDLAVTSAVDFDVSTVRIYLGRGDGTFAAPLSFSTGGIGPWQIIAADLNRDGNLDLVVSMILNQTVDISVLMGTGMAPFRSLLSFRSRNTSSLLLSGTGMVTGARISRYPVRSESCSCWAMEQVILDHLFSSPAWQAVPCKWWISTETDGRK